MYLNEEDFTNTLTPCWHFGHRPVTRNYRDGLKRNLVPMDNMGPTWGNKTYFRPTFPEDQFRESSMYYGVPEAPAPEYFQEKTHWMAYPWNGGNPTRNHRSVHVLWEKWLPKDHPNLDILLNRAGMCLYQPCDESEFVYPVNHPLFDEMCDCGRCNDANTHTDGHYNNFEPDVPYSRCTNNETTDYHPDYDPLMNDYFPETTFRYESECNILSFNIPLYAGHVNIDEALARGDPIPSTHPNVDALLRHAMTLDHPNADDILSKGDFSRSSGEPFSEFHAPIEPWIARSDWKLSPGALLVVHVCGIFAVAFVWRLLTGKACSGDGKEELFAPGEVNATMSIQVEDGKDTAALLSEAGFPNFDSEKSIGSNANLGVYRSSFRSGVGQTASFGFGNVPTEQRPSRAPSKQLTQALSGALSVMRESTAPPLNRTQRESEILHKKHKATEDLYDYGEYGNLPAPPPNSNIVRNASKILAEDMSTYNGSVASQAHSCFEARVPGTQWAIGEAVVVCSYIALNFWCVWLGNLNYTFNITDRTWARALGSLTAANFLFVVLPATRNNIVTWLFGLPFDHVILYHRMLARWAVLTAVAHMFMYLPIQWNINTWITGLVCLILAIIILATSIDTFRRKHFNFFFFCHFLFIPFFVAMWYHTPLAQPFVIAAIALYGLDRILREVWSGCFSHRALLFGSKGTGLAMVRCKKSPITNALDMHKTGQYFFVCFPDISKSEWHPFSVSNGPRELDVEFHIRDLGDWSGAVCRAAVESDRVSEMPPDFKNFSSAQQREFMLTHTNKKWPWVKIDGPYGVHDFNMRRYPQLVLCGGGVGITPVIGMMKDLYSVGNFSPEEKARIIPHVVRDVYAVWVVRHEEDAQWFLADLEACAQESKKKHFPNLHTWIYVTRGREDLKAPMNPGRPEFSEIFADMDKRSSQNHNASLVFACGPGAMVNELWDCSVTRTSQGVRTDFHHETFEF
jgi:NADPH oxidase